MHHSCEPGYSESYALHVLGLFSIRILAQRVPHSAILPPYPETTTISERIPKINDIEIAKQIGETGI